MTDFIINSEITNVEVENLFKYICGGSVGELEKYLEIMMRNLAENNVKWLWSKVQQRYPDLKVLDLTNNENVIKNSSVMIQQEGGVLEVNFDIDGSIVLTGPSELEQEGVWDD